MSTGFCLRFSLITGAVTAATTLILATIETNALITGDTIPAGLRGWMLWGTMAGIVTTSTALRLHRLDRIHRGQAELRERLDRLDRLLDAGGGMRGLIRSELHEALSASELTDAVERVLAPTLEAAEDYREIRQQLASVTPIHHQHN